MIDKIGKFFRDKSTGLRRRTLGIPLEDGLRHDVWQCGIQPGAHLRVFWKALRIGVGPAASLYVEGCEVARFDCFGDDSGRILGHYHVHLNHSRRVEFERTYFTEAGVAQQIARARSLLTDEIPALLKENVDPRVSRFGFDRRRLEKAARRAEERMLRYSKEVSLKNYTGPVDDIDSPPA